MANVKNFGIIGVGSDVQWGKTGPRLTQTAGTFQFKNSTLGADAPLTAAGITSSAGNVTLTTGSLEVVDTAGTVVIGNDTTLSRQQAGVYKFNGTAAVIVPTGTSAQQPGTPAVGMFRYNSDSTSMEYYNGSWTTLATGGAAVTAVSVATANGLAGSSSGGTTPTLTLSTTVTGILKGNGTAISAAVSGTDLKTVGGNTIIGSGDVGTITVPYGGTGLTSVATGNVLYASATNTLSAAAPGSTSGVQAWDADLDAIAAFTSTGFAVRTGTNTWAQRSITGTAGRITVADGDGVAASPTIDLDTVTQGSGSNFVKITLDSYGRVSGNSAVVTSDITALVDGTYVNVTGDSMSGNLTMTGGSTVTGLPDPVNATDAANKQYVDAVASSLNIHTPVETSTTPTGNLTAATYNNGTLGVGATLTANANASINSINSGAGVGGYNTLIVGSRVLVKDYTGTALSATVAGGGTGYTVSDVLTVVGGTGTAATFTVTSAPGGVIATVSLTTAGNYTVEPGNPVSVTGGTGTGATLDVVWIDTYNGIYTVTALGDGSNPWILTRATDADNHIAGQMRAGDFVFIQEGTLASTGWVEAFVGTGTGDAIIIGTDNIVYNQFSGAGTYTAGVGLSLSGTTFNVNLGAGIVQLPSDEVGIDLYDPSAGALILTTDGSTRVTTTGSQLYLLLDPAGALAQTSAGLKVNAASVTNSMLQNSSITLNPDAGGTGTVSLGGTLNLFGTAAQGISTTASGSTFTITAQDATTALKGVASFSSTNFNVTSGAVSIKAGGVNLTTNVTGVLPVANGGTNVSSLNANQVLYGGAGGTSVAQSANFSFDGTSTLTVGGASPLTVNGATGTIASTASNADINLTPNGTGSVVIGPTGANGTISSDTGFSLTVTGDSALALTSTSGAVTVTSTSGDTVMALAASSADKVTISGPTAAQYISGLTDNDLVTKYYVDQTAGFATGDIKAVSATFSLAATGTFNIGSALLAGSTILQVKVNVTAADTNTGTLSIGKSGNVAAYMTTSENDTQTVGMYIAEDMVTEAGSVQVIGTVAGTPAGAGSVTVVVTYQLA